MGTRKRRDKKDEGIGEDGGKRGERTKDWKNEVEGRRKGEGKRGWLGRRNVEGVEARGKGGTRGEHSLPGIR